MSKIENCGLDQYGAEPFEQQQFGTAGAEGVKAAAVSADKKRRCATDDRVTSGLQDWCRWGLSAQSVFGIRNLNVFLR